MVRGLKFGIIIFVILSLVVGGGYYYNTNKLVKLWEDKIYPSTSIHGIDVSGKTVAAASQIIEENTRYLITKKINVKHGDKIYTLDYASLDPKQNIEDTVNEAYRYGKDKGIFEKAKLIKSPEQKKYDLNLAYNNSAIDDFLNRVEKEINKEPTNASLEMTSSGIFKVHNDIVGEKFKKEDMKQVIISNINDGKEEVTEVLAVTEKISPNITAEALNKIDSKISSFSTSYASSQSGRAANVELATKQINGALVMPGEIFSFNARTGIRDAAHGYQVAPVIIKNKLEDGLGGGVCQVSTTLYNAAIRANLRSVSRRNHSLAPAYVAPGFDATVSENIDYKFKNSSQFPIYIEGYTKNRQVFFSVYSNSSLKNTNYELVSEVYEKIPAETQRVEDPTLSKGTVKEEEPPHTGYKVKVYLVTKQKNNEISREIISNDTYKKVDGIIKVGTME